MVEIEFEIVEDRLIEVGVEIIAPQWRLSSSWCRFRPGIFGQKKFLG